MRRHASVLVVTAGAGIALVGTFLTWIRSGSATRSSYEVFSVVDRLGFSPNGIVGIGLRAWPLVPLLLAVAVAAHWWRVDHAASHVATTVLTLVAAVYPGAIAVVVVNAPEISLFDVGDGPWVTVAGCAVMLVGLSIDLVPSRRPSAPAAGRS